MRGQDKSAIIFDCDGVLIESGDIKTQAFARLFAEHEKHLPEILAFHKEQAGISRFVKFRLIYQRWLQKELSAAEEERLGEKFADIVVEQVIQAPLVPGTVEFLNKFASTSRFFVVSGTPEEELERILIARELAPFFLERKGSPVTKPDAINSIIDRYGLDRGQVVMVGDGVSDQEAAQATDIGFIARITDENRELFHGCRWRINDLTLLDKTLQKMGKNIL